MLASQLIINLLFMGGCVLAGQSVATFTLRSRAHLPSTVYRIIDGVFVLSACATLCLSDIQCTSLSYNKITKQCSLSSFKVELISGEDIPVEEGVKVFDKEEVCSGGWLYHPYKGTCITISDISVDVSISDARLTCAEWGGWLMILDNMQAFQWYLTLRMYSDDWFSYNLKVGGFLNHTTNAWQWSNGNTAMLGSQYWAEGQPGGDADNLQLWGDKLDDGGSFFGQFACERNVI